MREREKGGRGKKRSASFVARNVTSSLALVDVLFFDRFSGAEYVTCACKNFTIDDFRVSLRMFPLLKIHLQTFPIVVSL